MAGFVRLFDFFPEILEDVTSPELVEKLHRTVFVPERSEPRGRFENWSVAGDATALLIYEGFIVRERTVFNRRGVHILGPGDLIMVAAPQTPELLGGTGAWRVLNPAKLIVLTDDAERILSRIPGYSQQVGMRLLQRSRTQEIQAAIAQVRGLEVRLLLLLWSLAERWGRGAGDATEVPFPLQHDLLADLAGATRPSVSEALKVLTSSGLVRRSEAGGGWLLCGEPPQNVSELLEVQAETSAALLQAAV